MSKQAMVKMEQAEIILIIVEGMVGERVDRPEGMSAADVLDELGFGSDEAAEDRDRLKETAGRLVEYFVQCMNEGGAEAKNLGVISEGMQQ
jgi:hypothetical protein